MRRVKLLVASRIEVDRDLIGHFLRSEGYELNFAVKAEDALDLLRYNPGFDLVIADVSLPGPDGGDIAFAIRKADNYIPLIGMTAFPLDWLLKQNIGTGVDAWLLKPFTRDVLERVIWKALVRVA